MADPLNGVTREEADQLAADVLKLASEPDDNLPSREELYARYGKPEQIERPNVASVLALLGKPDLPGVHAMVHRYSSVEAFEAFARANRERNQIGYHGIVQLGPAVTDDGVFGVLLLPPELRHG